MVSPRGLGQPDHLGSVTTNRHLLAAPEQRPGQHRVVIGLVRPLHRPAVPVPRRDQVTAVLNQPRGGFRVLWRLTYKWARYRHPNKSKKWVVTRYFGKHNKFRNDRWVFGDRRNVNDRGITYHMVKFSWTNIVRHQLVTGRASPDDPDLTDYWATRRKKVKPHWTATTYACSPGRTAAAHSAGTTYSPPTNHHNPHTNGNDGGWASPAGR